MLSIEEIKKILPQRFPFLMIDRVLELKENEKLVAIKNVSIGEQFFEGHFEKEKVMPGVLIIEALAQAGIVFFYYSKKPALGSIYYLGKVEADLASGKDFSEVAKSYSKKSSLGNVTRGQLKKNLEDVVFSLGVGQCSKPVEVEDGTYVFSVKEKLAPSQKTIDEVKDKIAVILENTKIEKGLKEWIEGLKDKAYISIRE